MRKTASFDLPIPPSVNSIWRGKTNGVYLSPKYKAWQEEAGLRLNQQHVPQLKPPYRVQYAFGRPDRRKRDVMNLEKALSDFLEAQDVLTNDSEIVDARIFWDETYVLAKPGTVHCTVESLL